MTQAEQISQAIATVERQISEAKSDTAKKVLAKKLERLKDDLKKTKPSLTTLSKARKTVKGLNKSAFQELVEELSKKPEYAFLKSYSQERFLRDKARTAKPKGYRFKGDNDNIPTADQVKKGLKDGTVYYEGRPIRSDISREIRLKTGGNIASFDWKSFTLQELNEALPSDVEITYYKTPEKSYNRPYSSENKKFYTKKRLTISQHGEAIVSKGNENIYLDIKCYDAEDRNDMSEYEVTVYSKENHAGLKDVAKSLIEKMKLGGNVKADLKALWDKTVDIAKKGYDKTKEVSKKKIHDGKKAIAIDVINETKGKVGKTDKSELMKAKSIIVKKFAEGGTVKFRKLAKSNNFDIIVSEGRFEVELDSNNKVKSVVHPSGERHKASECPIYQKYKKEINSYLTERFKDGGSIGFIPMDLENDLAITAQWGGTNVNGVIGILNAMIDSGITDEDLKPRPDKNTTFQYRKAVEKNIQEIWKKIQPKYKGDFKGNMYYSTIKRLVERSGSGDDILKRFKPFRKNQKDEFFKQTEYKVFNVTDKIYATDENFKTEELAEKFIKEFRKRHEKQGYYRDNEGNKINPNEIGLQVIDSEFNPYRMYGKGGGVGSMDVEIQGFKRNRMGTLSFDLKLSNMRKFQDFIVYPVQKGDDNIKIQSDTRIGRIYMSSGKGEMSQSHSSGAYGVHLAMDKLVPFQLSSEQLEELKSSLRATAGDKVGDYGIVSDNSGADQFAEGGTIDNSYLGTTRIGKGHYGWTAKTTTKKQINGYDWEITTMKRSSGDLVSSANGGKAEQKEGYSTFMYSPFEDPSLRLISSKPKMVNEKAVTKQHEEALKIFIEKLNEMKGDKMATGGKVGEKTYNVMHNVGKAKYVVNFHDGVKTHSDGSPFFDIEIFKNLKGLKAFTKKLESEGYKKQMKSGGALRTNEETYTMIYAQTLAYKTGLQAGAISHFAYENNLNDDELLNIVQGVGTKKLSVNDLVSAVVGTKGNKKAKEIVSFAKSDKAFSKMATGGKVDENLYYHILLDKDKNIRVAYLGYGDYAKNINKHSTIQWYKPTFDSLGDALDYFKKEVYAKLPQKEKESVMLFDSRDADLNAEPKMATGGKLESEYIVSLQDPNSGEIEKVNVMATSKEEAENTAIEESGYEGWEIAGVDKMATGGSIKASDKKFKEVQDLGSEQYYTRYFGKFETEKGEIELMVVATIRDLEDYVSEDELPEEGNFQLSFDIVPKEEYISEDLLEQANDEDSSAVSDDSLVNIVSYMGGLRYEPSEKVHFKTQEKALKHLMSIPLNKEINKNGEYPDNVIYSYYNRAGSTNEMYLDYMIGVSDKFFKKGGNVGKSKKNKYLYIPNQDISKIVLKSKQVIGKNRILDGAYVKGGKQTTKSVEKFSFPVGSVVWDKTHKRYGVVLNNFGNEFEGDGGEIRLDSDGVQPIFEYDKKFNRTDKYNLVPYGSREDKGNGDLTDIKESGQRLIDGRKEKGDEEYVKYYQDAYGDVIAGKIDGKPFKVNSEKVIGETSTGKSIYQKYTSMPDLSYEELKEASDIHKKFSKKAKTEAEKETALKYSREFMRMANEEKFAKGLGKFATGGNIDDSVEQLWRGYASAILFAETDYETEEPLDYNYSISDFDEETEKDSKNLLTKFYTENKKAIEESGLDLDTIGNDIWYTRAGHGAGFFDHNLDSDIEEALTSGAKALGEHPDVEVYDGKISVRGGRVFEYKRGGKITKEDALQEAIAMGVDFDKDFHAQSFGNELTELAKKVGYRKSPSSSGSTGRAFFYHLQKIYDKKKYATGGSVSQYIDGMTEDIILKSTVVYDNGGETLDRYTVFAPDGSVYGMSDTASGFNQYVGDDSEIEKGSHLGKRLKTVPKGIKWAILDRMKEEFAHGGSMYAGGGNTNYSYIEKDKIDRIVTNSGKEYGSNVILDGAYVTDRVRTPKMSRTQFEDETYSFGHGGNMQDFEPKSEDMRATILAIQRSRINPADVSPNFAKEIAMDIGRTITDKEAVRIAKGFGYEGKYATGGTVGDYFYDTRKDKAFQVIMEDGDKMAIQYLDRSKSPIGKAETISKNEFEYYVQMGAWNKWKQEYATGGEITPEERKQGLKNYPKLNF